ncbi:MAG: hypothetical protein GVY29_05605 [Spirochaetes bacterium]|nr:hypothetical protein [Spirochaetota bacterium]
MDEAEPGSNSAYEILAIEDAVAQFSGESRPVIQDHDGVVQIEPEVYSRQTEAGRDDVRELVDSVTHADSEDTESTSGIDEIFGGTPELDLSGGPRPYAPIGERRPVEGRLLFNDRGLNYDVFRLDYRENDSGIFKSLVSFTRVWAARAVLILQGNVDHGFAATYGLGLNEECLERFRLPGDSGVSQCVMNQRRIALLKEPLAKFKDFSTVCSHGDLEVLRRTLLIPIVFRSELGYMLLSVRDNIETIKDFFDLGQVEVTGSDE